MMQTRLAISAVVLVMSAGVSVQTATACSKEAVAGAVDRWTTVLAENNPDTIVALYSKDAVLWGTLSSTVRSDPAGLKSYFVGAFQALPKLTVKFGEQFIRVYGDTAVNTGYLHAILHEGRRNQINPRPLQFHVCEGGQRL